MARGVTRVTRNMIFPRFARSNAATATGWASQAAVTPSEKTMAISVLQTYCGPPPEWEQKVVVLVLRGEVASCGILYWSHNHRRHECLCFQGLFALPLFLDAVTLFTRRLLRQRWNGSISPALGNVTVNWYLCKKLTVKLPNRRPKFR